LAKVIAVFVALVSGCWLAPRSWAVEVIGVKIVVDEEERTTPAAWQRRLHERLNNASNIIHQYANVRFTLTEFGTWQSDNRIQDLSRSLRELEQEIEPAPAQLVIGFSSQYVFQQGINGLGGTRGPLRSHILLRESAPSTREPDRLEALVHELGHYLGAAHSAQFNSVMRPVIGDGRVRSKGYRIGFDPHNAQVIRLVASEISTLRVRNVAMFSQATRQKLLEHYRQLALELPEDPAAKRYVQILGDLALRPSPAPAGTPLALPVVRPR
jgi:hypothetical protein